MTPRSYHPLSTSIPFDDLERGRKYRFTLRAWVDQPCQKLNRAGYDHLTATFVELDSNGRGEQLFLRVTQAGGRYRKIYRAQVLLIEEAT